MFAIETQYTLNLEPIYFQTYFKYTSNVNPTYNNDAHNIHLLGSGEPNSPSPMRCHQINSGRACKSLVNLAPRNP